LLCNRDGIHPTAVSPIGVLLLLLGRVLRIVYQQIGISGQIHNLGVGPVKWVAYVARVNHHAVLAGDAVSKHTTWVIQSFGQYRRRVANDELLSVVNLLDQEVCLQIVERKRQVGINHLAGKDLLQPPSHSPLAEDDHTRPPFCAWREKGQSLNVIPVRVAEQQNRDHSLGGTLSQIQAQHPDSGPGVDDDDFAVNGLQLYACRIAADADGTRARYRN